MKPRCTGIPTKVGSGISGNLIGMDTDSISFVLFAMALVMSLNEAAGPYSVPPMFSIMNFDTSLT